MRISCWIIAIKVTIYLGKLGVSDLGIIMLEDIQYPKCKWLIHL